MPVTLILIAMLSGSNSLVVWLEQVVGKSFRCESENISYENSINVSLSVLVYSRNWNLPHLHP